MASAVKADKKARDALYKSFEELVIKSMAPGLPLPQKLALKNRAQELRDQWVELEAARFNADAAQYQKAAAKVGEAIVDLRRAIREIDDAIAIADKASKVFALVDKLLQTAVKNLPILL